MELESGVSSPLYDTYEINAVTFDTFIKQSLQILTKIEKHGISFEQAKFVFKDFQAISTVDNRFDYGETRFIILRQKLANK